MNPSTHQTQLVELKLEQCNGTITWNSPKTQDMLLHNPDELSPGLKMKYTTPCKGNLASLDLGFIDLTTLKTVDLGYVDMLSVPEEILSRISSCFKVILTYNCIFI